MAICKKIVRTSQRVCIGSLNQKIKLQLRKIKAPEQDNVDFRMQNETLSEVWAMIETVANRDFFGDTNTIQIVTHKFYIRYIPGFLIDRTIAVEFNNEKYKIIGVEDLNEEHRFWLIRTNVRGNASVAVNYGGLR